MTLAGAAGVPGPVRAAPVVMRRYMLGVLLAILALNAFGGGLYAMTGADGVPVAWLEGSAFATYFVPGIILFAIVGGTALLAAISVFAGRLDADDHAKLAGWTLVIWLVTQLAIVGFVSFLQPATAVLALAILNLAYHPWDRAAATR
jgi:hypothetical protein